MKDIRRRFSVVFLSGLLITHTLVPPLTGGILVAASTQPPQESAEPELPAHQSESETPESTLEAEEELTAVAEDSIPAQSTQAAELEGDVLLDIVESEKSEVASQTAEPVEEKTVTPRGATASAILGNASEQAPSGEVERSTTQNVSQSEDSEAVVEQILSSDATTGLNLLVGSEAAKLKTGSVSADVQVVNELNTNATGTDGFYQLHTHFDALTGDLDLSDLTAGCTQTPTPQTTRLSTQSALIETSVQVRARTGMNTLSADTADVETGDVRVSAEVLNAINTELGGDCWYYSLITLFDGGSGDIVLPYEYQFLNADVQAKSISLQRSSTQDAHITQQVTVHANTGLNTTEGVFSETGEVRSSVQSVTSANTQITGSNWFLLEVLNPHFWKGSLQNWRGDVVHAGDRSYYYWQLPSAMHSSFSPYAHANVDQRAIVSTQITVDAETGKNTVEANGGALRTGSVSLSAKLASVVNTAVSGSNWFFARLQLFDEYHGNVVLPRADLSLKTSDQSVSSGGSTQVTVVVANQGQLTADEVSLLVDLPTGWGIEHVNFTPQQGELALQLEDIPSSGQKNVEFAIRAPEIETRERVYIPIRVVTATQESEVSNNLQNIPVTVRKAVSVQDNAPQMGGEFAAVPYHAQESASVPQSIQEYLAPQFAHSRASTRVEFQSSNAGEPVSQPAVLGARIELPGSNRWCAENRVACETTAAAGSLLAAGLLAQFLRNRWRFE